MFSELKKACLKEGFALVGGVDLEHVISPLGEFYPQWQTHVSAYQDWIDAGHAAQMQYLVRGKERRFDPKLVFPEAKSVLSVAWAYSARPIELGSNGARLARYLRGQDYHLHLKEKLERILLPMKEQVPDLTWKITVDSSAVLERTWAWLSGLGWIGKNALLIHPQWGSYLYLAEVFLSHPLGQKPTPMASLCGHCERCLTGCPTQAFVRPRVLDSNRCIAYHTLENRKEAPLLPQGRTWVAGCDECQEVCPFNRKAARREHSESIKGEDWGWRELLAETKEQYLMRVKHTALDRVKFYQWERNLIHAFSNALLQGVYCPDAPRLIERRIKTMDLPLDQVLKWQHCLTILQNEGHGSQEVSA